MFKKIQLLIILLGATLLLQGCATQLPTFAHVHVGHALSAWTNTPSRIGLFILTENIGDDIAKLSVKADTQAQSGDYKNAKKNALKILPLIGSIDDEVLEPDQYTFLTAYRNAIDHLSFAMTSVDATSNLKDGMTELLSKKDIIIARAEVIKDLLRAIQAIEDNQSMAKAISKVRLLSVQNYEGSSSEYGLKQMRNEFFDVLSRENPPYTVPEKKYLFGLLRLPNGTWFWDFEAADTGGGSYGRYSY